MKLSTLRYRQPRESSVHHTTFTLRVDERPVGMVVYKMVNTQSFSTNTTHGSKMGKYELGTYISANNLGNRQHLPRSHCARRHWKSQNIMVWLLRDTDNTLFRCKWSYHRYCLVTRKTAPGGRKTAVPPTDVLPLWEQSYRHPMNVTSCIWKSFWAKETRRWIMMMV